ncbi:hypothetical protein CTZ27_19000 [Streptomyces griseocarneus]|nr:hypothetical protein CTZ27_19000 [Streptomyces griseocarneus]
MAQNQQLVFDELMASTKESALHLEMRDGYGVAIEAEDFATWKRTGLADTDPASEYWAPWVELIRRAVARGVAVRRARIISEPVTDYIRYEHAGTVVNVEAGEQVRWLPRRQASDIALPGNDFWLFDDRVVMFNHFTGDGAGDGYSQTDDPAVAQLCASAFRTVWDRAVPHAQFQV